MFEFNFLAFLKKFTLLPRIPAVSRPTQLSLWFAIFEIRDKGSPSAKVAAECLTGSKLKHSDFLL